MNACEPKGDLGRFRGACLQVHDLWHVLFGCDTNGLGELSLKARRLPARPGWPHRSE